MVYNIIGKSLSFFLLLGIVACTTPVEDICSVYEEGTEAAATASSMEELKNVRKETAEGLEDIVSSNREELKELLAGSQGIALLQNIKNAEAAYVNAVKGRITAIYPPVLQFCDVYNNAIVKLATVASIEELTVIAQGVVTEIHKINSDFAGALETMSPSERGQLQEAENSYKAAVERKQQEFM